MLKTYRVKDDRTDIDPTVVVGRDAVREWLRTAVLTARGEQPYLPEKYGIDMIQIMHSNDPAYYLEESIREIIELRDDVFLSGNPVCRVSPDGTEIYANIECRTIYGDFTLDVTYENRA